MEIDVERTIDNLQLMKKGLKNNDWCQGVVLSSEGAMCAVGAWNKEVLGLAKPSQISAEKARERNEMHFAYQMYLGLSASKIGNVFQNTLITFNDYHATSKEDMINQIDKIIDYLRVEFLEESEQ